MPDLPPSPAADAGESPAVPGSPPGDGGGGQSIFFGISIAAWQRSFREGGWIVVGQALTAVVGLIGLRLLTGFLPKDVFGQASLLIGMITLGRNVFIAPFFNAQIRLHHDFGARGELQWFTRQISADTWSATGVYVFVVLAISIAVQLRAGHIDVPMLLIPSALIASESLKAVRLNWFSNERFLATISVWMLLDSTLSLGMAAVLTWRSPTAASYILGMTIGSVIATLIFGYGLYPPPSPSQAKAPSISHPELLRQVIKYGLPFMPLAIVSWLINLGDRYEVDYFLTKYDVGMYVAAYSVASRPVLMFSGAIASFSRSLLFRAQSEGQLAKARKLTALWVLSTASGCGAIVLAFALFGRIATLLIAPEYRSGALRVMIWVAAGQGIFCVGQVIETRLMSFGLSKRLILPSLIGAAIELGSGVYLIPRFGIAGAAVTNIFGFGAAVIVLSVTLLRVRADASSGTSPGTSPGEFVPAAG